MNTKNKTVIEVHALQSPPANSMNRDGFQDVKTVEMAGTRTRLSSQSIKKVVREMCSEEYPDIMGGKLSLRWPSLVVDKLVESGLTREEAISRVAQCFDLKKSKKNEEPELKVDAAMYLTPSELSMIVENCKQDKVEKFGKLLKDKGKNREILSPAMFGRMFASKHDLSCDGAVSMAHAYTVHATKKQEDYFVLIDELNTQDAGAGHLQDNSFSAGLFYKFSKIQLGLLKESCGELASDEDIASACAEYVVSFIEALPKGKQNSFNCEVLPRFVIVKLSTTGRMRNGSNAFYIPLKDNDKVVENAISGLKLAVDNADKYYGTSDTKIVEGEPGVDFTRNDIKNKVKEAVLKNLFGE